MAGDLKTSQDGQELLLAFYGDDFTGSTDALESLVLNGVPAMLFLTPPSPGELRRNFPHLQAVGVAGEARSMSPEVMRKELEPVFRQLSDLKPRAFHYKVCSTFDSAPHIGNLGVAAELSLDIFGGDVVHVLGGSPHLGRYLAFGHLFARYGDDEQVYRIDRHPVMRNHPSTPMRESDLALHVGHQNEALEVESVSFEVMRDRARRGAFDELLRHADGRKRMLIQDAVTSEDGENFAAFVDAVVEENAPAVLLGPSSVENFLARRWSQLGKSAGVSISEGVTGAERLLVLSGSCSPVTADQIRTAADAGFAVVSIGPKELESGRVDEDRLFNQVERELAAGGSVVVATCQAERRGDQPIPARVIGNAFAGLLERSLAAHEDLSRVVLAGGDTSSHTLKRLPVTALEMIAPVSPGVPLCRLHSGEPRLDGMEIALKGGQLGGRDYFVRLRDGDD